MKLSMNMSKLTRGVSALVLPAVAILALGANSLLAGPAHAAKDKSGGDPIVEFDTTRGVIKAVIYQHDQPITSANFLDLVNRKFYDGLTFHRYEPGFCIQGGDPNGNGQGNFVDPATGHARHIKLEQSPKVIHDQAGILAYGPIGRSRFGPGGCQVLLLPWETLNFSTILKMAARAMPPSVKVIEGLNHVMDLRKGDKMMRVFEVKPGAK